jgi:hypothetical protein
MAKNNTNKIFSQETAEQHGFKPAYALNDGTGREVWVRGNGKNKQSIYVKPSPKMTTLSDYAFEKPNGEREYIGPKGKIPMFEEDIKRMVEESVKKIINEHDIYDSEDDSYNEFLECLHELEDIGNMINNFKSKYYLSKETAMLLNQAIECLNKVGTEMHINYM